MGFLCEVLHWQLLGLLNTLFRFCHSCLTNENLLQHRLCIISITWFYHCDHGARRYLRRVSCYKVFPKPLRGSSEQVQQHKAVWVRQLRKDACRPELHVLSLVLLVLVDFGIDNNANNSILVASFNISSQFSKTEHDQGHCCSWDVPPKLQDQHRGQDLW